MATSIGRDRPKLAARYSILLSHVEAGAQALESFFALLFLDTLARS